MLIAFLTEILVLIVRDLMNLTKYLIVNVEVTQNEIEK
jgi:hypothetical protein